MDIIKPMKWAHYQDVDERLATFLDGRWEAAKDQKPEDMANAGFFISTCVQCIYFHVLASK